THWNFNSLLIRDSELFLGALSFTFPATNITPSITLVNNLFENVGHVSVIWGVFNVNAYNNLFNLGEHYFFREGTDIWTAKDNVFDNCVIGDYSGIWVNDYNAYINATNTLQSPGPNSITLTNFSYVAGPLGSYYQLSTNLMDKGSRSASAAILSDYTVTTNQVKEGA